MARCAHTWVIVVNQGMTVLLECELCSSVVAVDVQHTPGGGHGFVFALLRPSDRARVSDDDLRALGDWFARQVGQTVAAHVPMAKRVRRSPARHKV